MRVALLCIGGPQDRIPGPRSPRVRMVQTVTCAIPAVLRAIPCPKRDPFAMIGALRTASTCGPEIEDSHDLRIHAVRRTADTREGHP